MLRTRVDTCRSGRARDCGSCVCIQIRVLASAANLILRGFVAAESDHERGVLKHGQTPNSDGQ